ncbi:MAG: sugar ABC transporter permease, partial [Rhodobacteraceae bacterium]|nr:sugar ABC transporter permease [Paracoccaceae bacterium]
MTTATPPKGTGPLGRREARLAWSLLFPTIFIVSLVVILPLLSIFWISVKPVGLADLRAPEAVVREDLRGRPQAVGDAAEIRYRLRNSSQDKVISGVTLVDRLPEGVRVAGDLPEACTLS